MAGRFWREAASLLLVSGPKPLKPTLKKKNVSSQVVSNYDVLLMKRSTKSSFMPKNYVFPGGTLDEADRDPAWYNLFEKFGLEKNHILKSLRKSCDMFSEGTEEHSVIPELAFKICSLRETFEEVGVLLVQDDRNPSHVSLFPLDRNELERWRSKVHQDAGEFIKLMSHIGKIPPVSRLSDWSHWLTPVSYGGKNRRFDTKFYAAFTGDSLPVDDILHSEVEEVRVGSPSEILDAYYDGEVNLAPPQIYELLKLLHFGNLDELVEYCERPKRVELKFPVVIYATDGKISVLPGDELYPKEPDFYGEKDQISLQFSLSELEEQSQCLHRFHFEKLKKTMFKIKNMKCAEEAVVFPISSGKFLGQS